MGSLTTKTREILVIGSFGLESRSDHQWKARGLGEQSGWQFTIRQEKVGRWRVNGTNSSGSRKRKRFIAADLSEAVEQAARILYGHSGDNDRPALDLASAFHRCVAIAAGSDEYQRQLIQFAGYFCQWAEDHGLTQWHQLRFEHIRQYMMDLFE